MKFKGPGNAVFDSENGTLTVDKAGVYSLESVPSQQPEWFETKMDDTGQILLSGYSYSQPSGPLLPQNIRFPYEGEIVLYNGEHWRVVSKTRSHGMEKTTFQCKLMRADSCD